MAADAEQLDAPPRRSRRRWQWLAAVLFVLLGVLAAAWLVRRPIAAHFVDRALSSRKVPARYTLAELGLSRQRLTNVVIGDPADPDLVADWVEVGTAVGLGGPAVTGIAAGHVRLRARLVDGRLSLGALDRLMPASSGKPVTLPHLFARVADARIRLETPQGLVGLKLSGSGALDDGFVGRLAAVSAHLDVGGCALTDASAALRLRVSDARPALEGPLRLGAVTCGATRVVAPGADVVVTLSEALDRWDGHARVAAARFDSAAGSTGQLLGRLRFAGTARATAGDATIGASALEIPQGRAQAATISGRYRLAPEGFQFSGRAGADHAVIAPGLLAALTPALSATAGTPVAPLTARFVAAARAAAGDLTLDAAIDAVSRDGASAIRVARADLSSASGARMRIDGAPLRFGGVELGGRIDLRGGGLPDMALALAQSAAGIDGTATIAPYAAGGARLALAPVRFTGIGGRTTRVVTRATLDGPLGDGAVRGVAMPIDLRFAGSRFVLGPACAPVGWQRIAISGLALDPGSLTLCPVDGALLTYDRGRTAGGARIAAPLLTGRLGTAPLRLAAADAVLRLRGGTFALGGVSAQLGATEQATRVAAGRLTGTIDHGALRGDFAAGGGRIGTVPLVLSDAAGAWRVVDGALTVEGGLTVSDANADAPRFKPLAGRGVILRLANGVINATGQLAAPKDGSLVADVAIEHRLAAGTGQAHLAVPGIAFANGGLQPDDLTPITYGVVAEVVGVVSGAGDIRWSEAGVTSTGRFGTAGLNLAAAFGPATGIRTTMTFSDLLGMVTEPDQQATVTSLNPGIAVENGVIRYRLNGPGRIDVADGRWPFAGGDLRLEPTTLDFSQAAQRRMTFRVTGVDAASFLQQFDFKNLNTTGTFDGVLPMVFDQSGGRIEAGHLAARTGGGIAYVGTITERDVGTWGNIAFQALKALDYRRLDLDVNGPLAGEMVTQIRFAGVSQGQGTKSNFLIRRLAKLPFVFNITIRAPFRQLIESVRGWYDPSRLIQRNLPALIEDQQRRETTPPLTAPPKPAPPAATPPPAEPRPFSIPKAR